MFTTSSNVYVCVWVSMCVTTSNKRERCKEAPVIAGMQLHWQSVGTRRVDDFGARELQLHAAQVVRGEKHAVEAAGSGKARLHEVACAQIANGVPSA